MTDAFCGEIILWAVPWTPDGWQLCDGSLLQIDQYQLLYAVIGTTYGGDGASTFAVPDLRGRVPLHRGTGPGLQTYTAGQQGGAAQVSLTSPNLPAHSHAMTASGDAGSTGTPTAGAWLASTGPNGGTNASYAAPGGPTVTLAPASIGTAGGGGAHENRQPSAVLNYIICAYGAYPPPPG